MFWCFYQSLALFMDGFYNTISIREPKLSPLLSRAITKHFLSPGHWRTRHSFPCSSSPYRCWPFRVAGDKLSRWDQSQPQWQLKATVRKIGNFYLTNALTPVTLEKYSLLCRGLIRQYFPCDDNQDQTCSMSSYLNTFEPSAVRYWSI